MSEFELNGDEVKAKAKRFFEAMFTAAMGMPCSVRFNKDGSIAYVVSAAEMEKAREKGSKMSDGLTPEVEIHLIGQFTEALEAMASERHGPDQQ